MTSRYCGPNPHGYATPKRGRFIPREKRTAKHIIYYLLCLVIFDILNDGAQALSMMIKKTTSRLSGSFNQRHFPAKLMIVRNKPIEIDSAGEVTCIKGYRVVAGLQHIVYKHRYLPPRYIVHLY